MRFLLIFLFFNYVFFSEEAPVQNAPSVVLQTGERAMVGPLVIQFKKVLSDSRCPKGVACIWAGEAKVLVAVYKDHKLLGEEILILPNAGSKLAWLENYFSGSGLSAIRGNLQPYPEIDQKIAIQDYSLSLQFREKEADKKD